MFTPKSYPKFNRVKKKLPDRLRQEIDIQVNKICGNPLIGELKVGDLAGVRVHKFKFLKEEYLIAYTVEEEQKLVILLAIGGHENFYRDLKLYLKS